MNTEFNISCYVQYPKHDYIRHTDIYNEEREQNCLICIYFNKYLLINNEFSGFVQGNIFLKLLPDPERKLDFSSKYEVEPRTFVVKEPSDYDYWGYSNKAKPIIDHILKCFHELVTDNIILQTFLEKLEQDHLEYIQLLNNKLEIYSEKLNNIKKYLP